VASEEASGMSRDDDDDDDNVSLASATYAGGVVVGFFTFVCTLCGAWRVCVLMIVMATSAWLLLPLWWVSERLFVICV
jgi:hypothetical protein